MQIPKIIHTVEKLISDNSPIILTAVGVVGTVSTAVLSVRAAFKQMDLVDAANEKHDLMNEAPIESTMGVVKVAWTAYIPPVASGACTIAAIVFANKISMGRAAALAAAYTLNQDRFTEYKDKIGEKLGVKKEEAVRDEIAQDHVNSNNSNAQVVVVSGKVMCYDLPTDRYFMSDMESLRQLENSINLSVIESGYAEFGDLSIGQGLEPVGYASSLGWATDCPLHLKFSSTIKDGAPVLVVNYEAYDIRFRKDSENPY